MSLSLEALLAATGAGAFILAFLLSLLMRRVATAIDYVDRPGAGHKQHARVMPYGGGVAIFLAGWATLALALWLAHLLSDDWVARQFGESIRAYVGGVRDKARPAVVILSGGLFIHLLGLIDDVRPLGPYVKLAGIAAVSVLVPLWSGVRVADMLGSAASITLTAVWFIVVINAFNFLDNMDGLSAGVAAICLLMFAVCGRLADQMLVPVLAVVWCGALLGFLCLNFPPASMFMGDAGSLLVGYGLAVVSTMTTYYEGGSNASGSLPPYALAMPLIVLAVPLYDCATVIWIRLREQRHPMRGDRRHFSHRLVDHGLTRRFAVLTIYVCTAATGLAATVLPGASLRVTLTVAAIVVLVLSIIAILERPARTEA